MRKLCVSLLRAVALAYIPVILALPLLTEEPAATIKIPYILTLLILLLYTLPFFVAYLEVCSFATDILEGNKLSRLQKILKAIAAVLLCGTLISTVYINSLPFVCFAFAGALCLVMIAERIVKIKRADKLKGFKDTRAVLIAVVIAVAILGIFLGINRAEQGKNMPDPDAPALCIMK